MMTDPSVNTGRAGGVGSSQQPVSIPQLGAVKARGGNNFEV